MKTRTRPLRLAVLLAVLSGACQSMSGTPYRAESLRLFTPMEFARIDEPGFTLLVGPLVDESSIVRFLGDRSRKLGPIANVLQVSVSSTASSIEISRRSFNLQIPSGEHLAPLFPHQVLAAVSLPNQYRDGGYPITASGTEATFFYLGATALGVAVENAGAKQYREAARLDVEQKTTPDHTLAANQTADLLLVFVPPNGKIPPSTPLEVAVELEVDGVLWVTRLNIPARSS